MAKRDIESSPGSLPQKEKRLREIAVFALMPLVIYLGICLLSFNPSDPGWSHEGHSEVVQNIGGRVGAFIADFALYFLGVSALLLPIILLVAGWRGFTLCKTSKPQFGRLH